VSDVASKPTCPYTGNPPQVYAISARKFDTVDPLRVKSTL